MAKKDFYAPQHSDALPIPNLEVLSLMKSFKSRKFVTETFNWQYYYWYLNNEGIQHLREYLNLPADVVPATLKPSKATGERPERSERPPRGDRPDFKKSGPEGSNFTPSFPRGEGAGGYRRGGDRE